MFNLTYHSSLKSFRFFSLLGIICFWGIAGPCAHAEPSDPIIAKGKSVEIRLSELEAILQNLPEKLASIPYANLYPLVLERLIQKQVGINYGRKAGIEKEQIFKDQLELLKDELISDIYLQKTVSATIDENTLKNAYDTFIQSVSPKELVRARHIMVTDEKQASRLIDRILDGEDFATLAQKYSRDSSAPKGGDLGFFEKNQMVPEFSEAAFALQPNEMTADPIQTNFGWHVIMVEERKTEPLPQYEDLRARIFQDILQEATFEHLIKITEESQIERFDIDGNPISRPTLGDMLNFARQ